MIDVSYRYKTGVWMMDEVTGEVHEVKPQEVHIHEGWGTPTEENKIKPAPKKNWKNNAA